MTTVKTSIVCEQEKKDSWMLQSCLEKVHIRHKTLTGNDGIVKEIESFGDLFPYAMHKRMIGVLITPKLKFYDIDFG